MGASFLYVPVYLTDISPPSVGGRVVTQHQVKITPLERQMLRLPPSTS